MAGSFTSNYADEDDSMSGINVTPLVDVTLVLLIVFMITVPAIVGSARVNVDLPETTAVPADAQPLPLVFALKRDSQGQPLLYLNEVPIDDAGLRRLLAGRATQDPNERVSLSADKGIPYGEVIAVVDLLESLGIKRLSLDTRHVESR